VVLVAMAAIGCATPAPTAAPTPTPTPIPVPFGVDDVLARLRTLDATYTLDDLRDNPTGALPNIRFIARTAAGYDTYPRIARVLVFATTALRTSAQPNFGEDHISGPYAQENWDGIAHSVWVGVGNVLVEVLMPGGTFGGRSPAPADLAYPAKVRAALEHAPNP
jgi:hypothetical protein